MVQLHSLENREYQLFRRNYNSIPDNPQRLGQAFVNHFDLQKSVQLKAIADKLYQLDGFKAIAFINQYFCFD